MCSTINYSELSELRRGSTIVNKNPFSAVWPFISLCLLGSPFQGEVGTGFFGALGATAMRCKRVRQGKAPTFPLLTATSDLS